MVVDDPAVCCVVEGSEEEADISVIGSSVTSSVEGFEVLAVIVGFEVVLGIELDGEDDEKDVVVGNVVVADEVLEVEIGDVAGEEMEVDDLVVCCVVEGNEEEADVSVSVVGSSVTSVEDFELLVVIVVFEVVIGIELDEEDDEKDVVVGDVIDRDEVLEVEIGDVAGEEMEVDDLVVCCVVEGNEEEADVSVSVVGSSVTSVEDFELLVVIVVFEVALGIELDEGDDEKDVVDGDVVDGDEVLDEVEIGDAAGEEMEVDEFAVC